MLLLSIVIPILWGLFILLNPKFKSRGQLLFVTGTGLGCAACLGISVILQKSAEYFVYSFGSNLNIYFNLDLLGRLFAAVMILVWLLSGIHAFEYMKHEQEEKRFFGFYVMVFGILHGLCFSGNLVTFYLFYELMTLLSVPLILHNRSKEAIMGGLKYLFYSLFGAYMVLFGLFFLNRYTTTLNFVPGGTLNMELVTGHETLLLITAASMILGFGVKSGMFPLHAWLPTAHPVAPAPASAVMSGIIVKMGVLGMIRTVYYLIGTEFLRGTWVQKGWMTLSLLTIFLGSMLAYRETGLKKRLAYSTVSQASYILFGLSLLQPQAFTGAALHVVFHAVIKSCLFLSAGAIIYKTGKTCVGDLLGVGKDMPVTLWCYTFASVALIGIPPASGFISKWHLALGSLDSGISVFSWLGPVILLISALLTAGYLLPVTISAFLPGDDFDYTQVTSREPTLWMVFPLFCLAGLAILFGLFPSPLTDYIAQITATLW